MSGVPSHLPRYPERITHIEKTDLLHHLCLNCDLGDGGFGANDHRDLGLGGSGRGSDTGGDHHFLIGDGGGSGSKGGGYDDGEGIGDLSHLHWCRRPFSPPHQSSSRSLFCRPSHSRTRDLRNPPLPHQSSRSSNGGRLQGTNHSSDGHKDSTSRSVGESDLTEGGGEGLG